MMSMSIGHQQQLQQLIPANDDGDVPRPLRSSQPRDPHPSHLLLVDSAVVPVPSVPILEDPFLQRLAGPLPGRGVAYIVSQ